MSESVNAGPRSVEQEITELFAGLQVIPTIIASRTDIDLIEGGYPLEDGAWQLMLPLEEEA